MGVAAEKWWLLLNPLRQHRARHQVCLAQAEIRHQSIEHKRLIVEDEEVPNEVKLSEENVDTVTKKHKYTDASFYKYIEEFYQNFTNKSVIFSKGKKINAFALLTKEYPDLTRIQGDQLIKTCAMKCRENINIRNGKKNKSTFFNN